METKTLDVTFMTVKEFREIMARELGWETFTHTLYDYPDDKRTLLLANTFFETYAASHKHDLLSVLQRVQLSDAYGHPGLHIYGVELVLAELAAAGIIPKTDYVLTP